MPGLSTGGEECMRCMQSGILGLEVSVMGMVTVRNLDEQVKARLRERAARRGHSMEAEIREILADAVRTEVEPPSLAEAFVAAFDGMSAGIPIPARSTETQRPVDL